MTPATPADLKSVTSKINLERGASDRSKSAGCRDRVLNGRPRRSAGRPREFAGGLGTRHGRCNDWLCRSNTKCGQGEMGEANSGNTAHAKVRGLTRSVSSDAAIIAALDQIRG